MLKDHPKGLFVLFFSNMGERFGYYTSLAILMLYVQAKFGLDTEASGIMWSSFLTAIYFVPLIGGIVADKVGYSKIILVGIILMLLGYAMMGIPGTTLFFVYLSLAVIAIGTGFFKGNLVVLLGNLYEDNRYKKLHSAAFSIFYMGINIGAFYAPHAATAIRDWLMKNSGFTYNEEIPGLAHSFLKGTLPDSSKLMAYAQEQLGGAAVNLTDFCNQYIDAVGNAYNAGFAIAAASMIVSLIIFVAFKKYYKQADYTQKQKMEAGSTEVELTPQQVKDRMVALILVFIVVIFFWMAFHQNGYVLTFFARDYTVSKVGAGMFSFFDLLLIHGVAAFIIGLYFLISKKMKGNYKILGATLAVGGAVLAYYRYISFLPEGNKISAELFQHFNPFFIVFLTPVIVAFFSWLNSKGKEPTSPAKIGIGMAITGFAYLILVIASIGLPAPSELAGAVSPERVSPSPLISLYFTITIAELFLSPMGLAFVAKVAPPKYKGTMQGGWLAATAIGNLLSGLPVGLLYERLELWQTLLVLGGLAFTAALVIALIYKKLMRALNS